MWIRWSSRCWRKRCTGIIMNMTRAVPVAVTSIMRDITVNAITTMRNITVMKARVTIIMDIITIIRSIMVIPTIMKERVTTIMNTIIITTRLTTMSIIMTMVRIAPAAVTTTPIMTTIMQMKYL